MTVICVWMLHVQLLRNLEVILTDIAHYMIHMHRWKTHPSKLNYESIIYNLTNLCIVFFFFVLNIFVYSFVFLSNYLLQYILYLYIFSTVKGRPEILMSPPCLEYQDCQFESIIYTSSPVLLPGPVALPRREAGGFMSPPCMEFQGCQFGPTFLYRLSCSSA